MSDRIGDDILLERMTRLEDHQIEHADALDVKLSYVLVAIVFLLQLSVALYPIPMTRLPAALAMIATACVIVAGIGTFYGLALTRWDREDAQELERTRDNYVVECQKQGLSLDAIQSGLIEGFIEVTRQRVAKNAEPLNDKVFWLRLAYIVSALAVALYTLTGVLLVASHAH